MKSEREEVMTYELERADGERMTLLYSMGAWVKEKEEIFTIVKDDDQNVGVSIIFSNKQK